MLTLKKEEGREGGREAGLQAVRERAGELGDRTGGQIT